MKTKQEESGTEGFEMVSRHLIIERDLNHFGNLFGGSLLYWLDESSYLYVISHTGYANMVTVSLDDVNFRAPGHKGDAIAIYCRILQVGHSSVTLQTRAYVEEPESGNRRVLITCRFTFVALKENRPYAYFDSEAYKNWLAKRRDTTLL